MVVRLPVADDVDDEELNPAGAALEPEDDVPAHPDRFARTRPPA
jgi:hypothetical protein